MDTVKPPVANLTPEPAGPTSAVAQPMTGNNPGKVITIVAFVLSLLNGGILSLILGIVGLVKSKKAGQKYGLAIAAIVLSGLDIIFITPIIIFFILASYSGITLKANEQSACSQQGGTGQVIVSGQTYVCGSTN